MALLIGLAICCGFIYWCYYSVCEWWKDTTNQWESNKIAREQQERQQESKRQQQDYERGNYYGTFEHTKQSLMQNKNTTDYLKLGYMYKNGYGTTKDYNKAAMLSKS